MNKWMRFSVWVGLLLTLLAWAVASPVGASPDEDFHLISIYCSSGETQSICEPAGNPAAPGVSVGLLRVNCYAGEAKESARCLNDLGVFSDTGIQKTTRGNFQGTYPPLFYATMHLFATNNVQASVIAMRMFNALLFVGLGYALTLILPFRAQPSASFTVLLTVVPLGLFFIPSINPSSWAITGIFATFFGIVSLRKAKNKAVLVSAIFVSLIGVVMALSSRYDGILYVLLASCAAWFVAQGAQQRKRILGIGLWASIVILLAVAVGLTLLSEVSLVDKATDLHISPAESSGQTWLGALSTNLARMPLFWAGFSGALGLGWLDTSMPYSTWMIAAACLWAAVFMQLGRINKRQLLATLLLGALLLILPLSILQWTLSEVGETIQPRYFYPLLLLVVATAFFQEQTNAPRFSITQGIILITALFIAQAFAIYTNLRRYVTGIGGNLNSWNLDSMTSAGWWWPTGPTPMLVFGISMLGFAIFLASSFVSYGQIPLALSARSLKSMQHMRALNGTRKINPAGDSHNDERVNSHTGCT